MKLALIGRSMISPFGLAIRPRMPASWRICLNEPRAPELAIMKMGFSSSRCSCIASPTSSVAPFHLSITASLRSSWEIRPMSYWSRMSATSDSIRSRISSFLGGITTSFLDTVMPAWLAKWKPSSLKASSTCAVACGPCCSTSPSMTAPMSRLRRAEFTNV